MFEGVCWAADGVAVEFGGCCDWTANGDEDRVVGIFTACARGAVCLWPLASIRTDVPHTCNRT